MSVNVIQNLKKKIPLYPGYEDLGSVAIPVSLE